ncbi:hypothetical protein ACGFZK_32110 [Streptomyces sp. NPDC048257]|uniref:hypothetical protein n=1 Tax=Streptomyces sp. NPDC048257 TaxID=3365526 RepID=UPI00371B89D1
MPELRLAVGLLEGAVHQEFFTPQAPAELAAVLAGEPLGTADRLVASIRASACPQPL